MRTGNLYKTKYGNIIIISKIEGDLVHWISFDSSNVTGCSHIKTQNTEAKCWNCYVNDGGSNEEKCEFCSDTGNYIKTIFGLDQAEYLADNVKDYIIKSLTKNFNF